VGVPLLLASWVGWPLPSSLPSLDTLEQAAQSGVRDEVLVNTLAVIAWLAWAQIVLALVVEMIALVRGRQSVHLPVIPGFQVTAGRLVAGIVMLASTVHPAAPTPSPTHPVAVVVDATAPSSLGSAMDKRGRGRPQQCSPRWSPHDRPHTRRHRPRPIRPSPSSGTTATGPSPNAPWATGCGGERSSTSTSDARSPTAQRSAAGDHTLHAGWVLVLPSDAVVEPTAAPVVDATPSAEVPAASETEVVVERGDNLWTISEDRIESELGREAGDPEVAPYWQTVVDANQDRYVQPGNPNLIYPGQVLVLPPTGHAQPAGDPPTEAAPEPADAGGPSETPPPPPTPQTDAPAIDETPTTVTTVPTTASDEAAPSSADTTARADTHADTDAETNDSSLVAVALGALSSIALAVGLKRLLDRRRRRFTNEHPGQLPGRTPPEQHEVHQAIVAQADEERIDDLQGVLGRLSASLAASGSDRRPRMIRHSGDVLEVLLDEPDTHAPAGWNSTDDGTVWTLVDVPDPESPYEGPLSPAPLMVTVGQPEDDAQLYLDLEADGLISLTGDGEVAANLGRSIVTELTLSPLADTIRVIAIGDVVDPDAKVLEHLTIVESWDSHAEDLMAWTSQSHDALGENGWANAFIGRGTDPDHDALVPIAVVADRPPPDDLAAALRSAQPSAVAVVVVGDFPDALATVRCEDDALNFDMVDLACAPQQMDADELAAISSVLVATDSPEEQELMEQLRAEFERQHRRTGTVPRTQTQATQGYRGERTSHRRPRCSCAFSATSKSTAGSR
jgi:LysM repeat protein